jgi:hypothetical protein
MTTTLQLTNALEPLFFNRSGTLIMCASIVVILAMPMTLLARLVYLGLTSVAPIFEKSITKEVAVTSFWHINVPNAITACVGVGLSVAIGIGAVYPGQRSIAYDQAQELASVLQGNHFSVKIFDAYENGEKYRRATISENLSADSTEKIFGQSVALPTPHREITLSWAQALQADSAVRTVSHGRVALVTR